MVVVVGVCAGAFADRSPDAQAAVGSTPVAALSSLWSHADTTWSTVRLDPRVRGEGVRRTTRDSVLDRDLARRAAVLRHRPATPPGLPVGAPVAGAISSPFGPRRHPVTGRLRTHRGTDFAVPLRTPVRVTADGRVRSVGRRSGYGLTVEVEHRDPTGLATSTLYGHLDDATVVPGVLVRRGAVVGVSGGVGPGAGLSTGPHVHYEVREWRASGGPETVDPSVLYTRARAWQAETARQRRRLLADAWASRLARRGGDDAVPPAPQPVPRTDDR